MNTFTRAGLTVLIGLIIWFLPHTEAIKPEGWLYFATLAYGDHGYLWCSCRSCN